MVGQPGLLEIFVGWGESLVDGSAIVGLRVEWRRILHAGVLIFACVSAIIHLRSFKLLENKKTSLKAFEWAMFIRGRALSLK
jgi:hypothetical protein